MSRNSEPQWRWLVCYDVANPRRRRRIAKRLEGSGQRVQRSVFVVEDTPDGVFSLATRCRQGLGPSDSFKVYQLVRRTKVTRMRAAPPTLPDFWTA